MYFPANVAKFSSLGGFQRLLVFIGLAFIELIFTSYAFNFPTALSEWSNPVAYLKGLAQGICIAVLMFFLIVGHKRNKIILAWSHIARTQGWGRVVLTNLALFGLLLAATVALSNLAARSPEPPWHWFALYCCLLLTTAISLTAVAAPRPFWKRLWAVAPSEIATALMIGILLVLAGKLSLESWAGLSSATLKSAHWILTLYETDVVLDTKHQILGVGNFRVLILKQCSGYEGIGLVSTFLGFYCYLMRRQLRFPHTLVLIPVGILAVWILNLLRIAALVSIGHHLSADVAVNGFHSQAGWMGFLFVAVGAMAASQKMPFFSLRRVSNPGSIDRHRQTSGVPASLEFLAPFMALMAASIFCSAFAPHDQGLYAIKVAGISAVLWLFRSAYLPLVSGASWSSVVIGLAVGAVWIVTDRGNGPETPLGPWLASLPLWLAAVWLSLRALGSIVLVPVAEELAFRGYLFRMLISTRFESVDFGEFRWLAFIGSSVAFGLMHQRWVAACLAGAIYALLMCRTKKLSDAIAAHMASNAALISWAIAAQQWSLL
jgi:exosortase E/protease (VPEID-CTERM system)